MSVNEVSQQSFQQAVVESDVPVLVNLFAARFPESQGLDPVLDEIAEDYAGSLSVVKIDVEQSPGVAQAFRVQAVPVTALVVDGRPLELVEGVVSKARLVEMISKVVEAKPGGVQNWDVKKAAIEVKEKKVRPVDLREEGDYGRARLPGAVNAPPERFDAAVARLKSSKKTLLFYSRDSKDIQTSADRAVAAGLNVAILTGGLLGWEAEGKPVEKGSPTVELL